MDGLYERKGWFGRHHGDGLKNNNTDEKYLVCNFRILIATQRPQCNILSTAINFALENL